MSEYIKREELIDNIVRIDDLRRLNTKTIGEAIDKTTSIDIVHCKDCSKYLYDESRDLWYCGAWSGLGGAEEDDYCSYGEREDERNKE